MAIDTAPFEQIGIHVDSQELERLIGAAIREMLPLQRPPRPDRALPVEEAEALRSAGMMLNEPPACAEDALVRSAAEFAALVAASYSVSEAATRLGVDPSRVRHRLADHTLFGVRLSSGWRVPAFQFADRQIVPDLERVLPRLPSDLHPLSVLHWLTLPNPDLVIGTEERPVSPLAWLRLGMDPAVVASLAEDVGSGA